MNTPSSTMIICSILTTHAFTLPKIIWHVLIVHWMYSNSLSCHLNVEVISSFCILMSIQLAVHVAKTWPVKCHFHPLCSWWGAEEGPALGKARPGQCLHASHCFPQRGGTSVWLGGYSTCLYLSVLWHCLISLSPGCCLETKLVLLFWERKAGPRCSFPCSAWCQPSPGGFRQAPVLVLTDVHSSREKARVNQARFTFPVLWGRAH